MTEFYDSHARLGSKCNEEESGDFSVNCCLWSIGTAQRDI